MENEFEYRELTVEEDANYRERCHPWAAFHPCARRSVGSEFWTLHFETMEEFKERERLGLLIAG